MQKRLEVWLDPSLKYTTEFKDELKKDMEQFMETVIREVEIRNSVSIKPGGKIYPRESEPRWGTLGAFATASDVSGESSTAGPSIAGLTCQHVLQASSRCYIDTENTPEKTELGSEIQPQTVAANMDGLAAVKIDQATVSQHCSLQMEWKNRSLRTTLHNGTGNLKDRIVYKKGATTGETEGTVLATTFGGRDGIVIKGTTETPFSKPGDSGSVVFRFPDNSADDDTAEVISMVQGEAIETGEEEPLATMSFLLNDAIHDFKEKKSVSLQLI